MPPDDEQINIVTPEGKAIRIPASSLPSALRQGSHVQRPDEEAASAVAAGRRSSAGWLNSAVAGALRGASLGLSDVGLVAIGGENARDTLNVNREVYPTTSTVSEIAGALATAVPSGGG